MKEEQETQDGEGDVAVTSGLKVQQTLGKVPFTKLVLSRACSELEFIPQKCYPPWKYKVHTQQFPTVGEKYGLERNIFVLKSSKGN